MSIVGHSSSYTFCTRGFDIYIKPNINRANDDDDDDDVENEMILLWDQKISLLSTWVDY